MNQFLKENNSFKFTEVIALFVGTPLVLLISIPVFYKIIYLLIGIIYIILVSIFIEKFQITNIDKNFKKTTIKQIGIRFLIISLLTTTVLYIQDKESLFNVVLNKPFLWLKFSGIYILFSVIPQELFYRTFFVKRYKNLFKDKWVFILINSLLFSFGHIWFQSWIVLSFTFVGSLLFLTTYLQTKSTWLIIFEHALYGVWLYTVGYGALFMFPV